MYCANAIDEIPPAEVAARAPLRWNITDAEAHWAILRKLSRSRFRRQRDPEYTADFVSIEPSGNRSTEAALTRRDPPEPREASRANGCPFLEPRGARQA